VTEKRREAQAQAFKTLLEGEKSQHPSTPEHESPRACREFHQAWNGGFPYRSAAQRILHMRRGYRRTPSLGIDTPGRTPAKTWLPRYFFGRKKTKAADFSAA
jgi:hypothetical protein